MKYFFAFIFLFFVAAHAQKPLPPAPSIFIHDEAKLFNQTETLQLNKKLENFQKQTGGQMVVAVFNSLQNENFEDYVNRLFRHWGVGQKEKNNGVLVVVAIQDRMYRTEVGYGFEGVLTDVLTAQLQREILVPAFREGRFVDGFSKLIDEYTQVVTSQGEYVSPYQDKNIKGRVFRLILFFVILFMFLGVPFFGSHSVYRSRNHRGRWYDNHWGGGGSGWGGGSGGGGFSGGGGWSGGGGSSGKW